MWKCYKIIVPSQKLLFRWNYYICFVFKLSSVPTYILYDNFYVNLNLKNLFKHQDHDLTLMVVLLVFDIYRIPLVAKETE